MGFAEVAGSKEDAEISLRISRGGLEPPYWQEKVLNAPESIVGCRNRDPRSKR